MKHNRAYLRAQAQRKKNKVKNYQVAEWWFWQNKELAPAQIGFLARTPKPCSWWCCSQRDNPKIERRQGKKEIQQQMLP
jgi:hypothetical protein